MGPFVFLRAIEPQGRREVAGFTLVEDPHGVEDVSPLRRESYVSPLEFGDQHLQVERPEVATAEVSALPVERGTLGDLSERILVGICMFVIQCMPDHGVLDGPKPMG